MVTNCKSISAFSSLRKNGSNYNSNARFLSNPGDSPRTKILANGIMCGAKKMYFTSTKNINSIITAEKST
jgi:hypothetical protein